MIFNDRNLKFLRTWEVAQKRVINVSTLQNYQYLEGLSSRKFGATSMNSESCRSHTVFTCVIESWSKETSSNDYSSSKNSLISFVDLAGLVKDKQVDAEREFEKKRKDLKSSLSHLGHLVDMLAAGTQPDEAMYKDSSLTHILQQSLGGNAKLVVISTISLDIKYSS